jgi:hypothetical protein
VRCSGSNPPQHRVPRNHGPAAQGVEAGARDEEGQHVDGGRAPARRLLATLLREAIQGGGVWGMVVSFYC